MIIAVVPARAGSKGFPNKNIARISGATLIEHAIRVGQESKLIDRVYISTDSVEYLKIAEAANAYSLGIRSESLSGDNASTVDVLTDMLDSPELSKASYVVLLQPTSPIRTARQVDECISIAIKSGQSVVTVSRVEDPHPLKMKKIIDGKLVPFLEEGNSEVARQSLPSAYELTGAIYVSSRANIIANQSLFSDETSPYIQNRFVNIDTRQDLDYLEFLISSGKVELCE